MDSAMIKRTQDSLGKYVKKPPLTEKLLNKPPFRFLFDVFNAVIKTTGSFEGLYSVGEQNIENIKDRDDKMKYLQKMIDVIKLATNRELTVRTSKIVAGQEPEKTNELLQLIGEVIEKNLDWRSAVDSVVNKSSSPTKPHKALEKPKEKSTKIKEHSKELRKESKTSTTVSPTVKEEQKSKLKSSTKKEKTKTTDVKPNKEKQNSDSKDKVSRKTKDDKSKQTKSKIVTKEKTPSPKSDEKIENEKEQQIQNEVNEVERNHEKPPTPLKNVVGSNTQNQATTETPADTPLVEEPRSSGENLKNVISYTTNDHQIHKENKQHEKESHEMSSIPNILPNTASDQLYAEHIESESSKKSDSRKSSANRKSSGKSRRSSASKVRNSESDASQATTNNVESLTTLNEDDPSKAVSPIDTQAALSEQPKSIAEPSKLIDNAAHIVKRESTFTRDNSIESSTNRPRTSLRPPSARPASARPGAPRRRDRNVEIILQPNDQLKMSGVNVKLETFGDFGDDGENLVIIENANVDETLAELSSTKPGNDNNLENDMEQRGHLVQQILETQKELVQQNSDLTGRQEKESEASSVVNMRQSSARQMNNLRDVIQNLTKSVNPFGKLMDFIPEDIDAMQLEMTMWRDSYTQTANELKKEKSLTESVTEPMKSQLTQIEANIKEYQEIIDASHSKILQNSEKILKMLTEQ